jgi:undecaprenyl-diphosphatase
MVRVDLWIALITLALGTFVAVTHQSMAEGRAEAADRAILRWMAERRTPSRDSLMVGITTFGSRTFMAPLIVATLVILIVRRDRREAIHLVVAALGVGALASVTKGIVERARPTEVQHVVHVSGFSYPSGHSLATAALYITIAVIASSHLRKRPAKLAVVTGVASLVALVGLSRVYLGVHYPSDVLGGMSLGVSWALMLAAAVAVLGARRATS